MQTQPKDIKREKYVFHLHKKINKKYLEEKDQQPKEKYTSEKNQHERRNITQKRLLEQWPKQDIMHIEQDVEKLVLQVNEKKVNPRKVKKLPKTIMKKKKDQLTKSTE